MNSETATRARELADRLISARRSQVQMPLAEAEALSAGLDEAGAYVVQARVCEAFGPARAFKTGRKSVDAPVRFAPILNGGLRPSGTLFSAQEFSSCAIELEIGFRVDQALPPLDADDFAAKARRSVTAMPVIETVFGRVEDFATMPDVLKLADNQLNAGLVWAEPIAASDRDGDLDLVKPMVDLRFDGASVVSGRCLVPGGDAFEVFLAFAAAIGAHCGGLQVGQIVTTGSLTGMIFIDPGTVVEGYIHGLGSVTTHYV